MLNEPHFPSQALNEILPSDLRLINGHISGVNVQLPFPHLLTASMSVQVDAIHLKCGPREIEPNNPVLQHTSNLSESLFAVSDDFMSQSLSGQEQLELTRSFAQMDAHQKQMARENITNLSNSANESDDDEFRPPGGFPAAGAYAQTSDPAERDSMSLIAVAIENILARLQFRIGKVYVTFEPSAPASKDTQQDVIQVRLEDLQFSTEESADETVERIFKMRNFSVWLCSPRSSAIRESQARKDSDLSTSQSLYQSAVQDTDDGTDSSVETIEQSPPDLGKTLDQDSPLLSSGEKGLTMIMSQDAQRKSIVSLTMDKISCSASLQQLRTIIRISQSWPKHAPKTNVTTRQTSAIDAMTICATFAALSVHVYDDFGAHDRTNQHEAVPKGLQLSLNESTMSSDNGEIEINIDDISLDWKDDLKPARSLPTKSLISFGAIKGSAFQPTQPDNTINRHDDSTIPSLTIAQLEQRQPSLQKAIQACLSPEVSKIQFVGPCVHLESQSMADLLGFFKSLDSNVLDVISTNPSPAPVGTAPADQSSGQWCVGADLFRLEILFPYLEHYYDLPKEMLEGGRRIVIDLHSPSWKQGVGEADPDSLEFDQLLFHLGASQSSSLDGICAASTLTPSPPTDGNTRPVVKIGKSGPGISQCHVSLPHVQVEIGQQTSASLQYLADDAGRWLESLLHAERARKRDDFKFASSRLFTKSTSAFASLQLDESVATLTTASRLIGSCHVKVTNIKLRGSNSSLLLLATESRLALSSVQGKQHGSALSVTVGSTTSWVSNSSSDTSRLLETRSSTRPDTPQDGACPPVVDLTFTTLQSNGDAESLKITDIKAHLSGLILYYSGQQEWMSDLARLVKAPAGAFEGVTPSDVTKITATAEKFALMFKPVLSSESLCFDLKQVRVRTNKQHHATSQILGLKSDEVVLWAAESVNDSHCRGDGWSVSL